jgi:hypothetical protein
MCESKKHWISYVIPVILTSLGLILTLTIFSSKTTSSNIIYFVLGIFLILRNLNSILKIKSTLLILKEDVLIIKEGYLSWKRVHFEIPIGDIYESFYRYGFWSKILGYGQITIRRTDGNTTNFIFDKMTNFKDLVGEINYKVQEFKKSNKQNIIINQNNISISDELTKLNILLKEGVLTQAEFDLQKQKLLNL